MGLETVLWRSVGLFRVAALCYAGLLIANGFRDYRHPLGGWLVFAAMAGWTVVAGVAYAVPARRGWPLLLTDLIVTGACLLASRWVMPAEDLRAGAATLPMAWVAGPVLAWAAIGGPRGAAIAAAVLGAIDVGIRGGITPVTLNSAVLLLLAGVVMGYMIRLAIRTEQRLHRATEIEAATRERERLARDIHDSVLQVLALVRRRGAELGGEAAELGHLAGEQEATLRALIGAGAGSPTEVGMVDLRARLGRYAAAKVSIVSPATAVPLPSLLADEVAAAVGSALDNVRVHCPPTTQAWVLVEDEGEAVTVTVRDDGPGIPDGRLAAARAAGRLGIAQSIEGRVRDIGGSMTISSAPGTGAEVELRIPRPRTEWRNDR